MDFSLENASLAVLVVGFVVCAAVIAVAGTLLARRADRIADVTGLGEALIGAVLLGGSTSLPGITTSVAATWAEGSSAEPGPPFETGLSALLRMRKLVGTSS